jgi:hypothetical protein
MQDISRLLLVGADGVLDKRQLVLCLLLLLLQVLLEVAGDTLAALPAAKARPVSHTADLQF